MFPLFTYLAPLLVVSCCFNSLFAEDKTKLMTQPGKQIAKTFELLDENQEKLTISYWFYLPKDYDKSEETFPLMLFLHGAGERGTDLNAVKKHGPPKLADQKDFPFIIVSPQCAKRVWWNTEKNLKLLAKLIDQVEADYRVDSSRIYCTGLSMGGYGTWSMVAKYPDRFAAAIPICGGGDPQQAKAISKTPIWAFHGDADSVVPLKRSEEMVAAVKEVRGNVKLTVYPEVQHDSWTETYNNEEIYTWLLSHLKSN